MVETKYLQQIFWRSHLYTYWQTCENLTHRGRKVFVVQWTTNTCQKFVNVHFTFAHTHFQVVMRRWTSTSEHKAYSILQFFLQKVCQWAHSWAILHTWPAHHTMIYSWTKSIKVHICAAILLICAAILHTGPALPPTQPRVSSHTHRMTGDGKLRLRNSKFLLLRFMENYDFNIFRILWCHSKDNMAYL